MKTEAAYQPLTGWPAAQAVLAAIVILTVSMWLGSLVLPFIFSISAKTNSGTLMTVGGLACVQLLVTCLIVLAARRGGIRARDNLALCKPLPGCRQMAKAFGGLLLIVIPYSVLVMWISPDSLVRDLKPFSEMLQSPWWWLVLIVVGIGAPVMEELLFRGFLLSALARSRLGFTGAVLVTTAAWSLLHFGYSLAGLIEVFIVGIYFGWLIWSSGRLWLALFCHAAYNTTLMLILLRAPLVG